MIDDADIPGGIRPHHAEDHHDVFVVGDDAIELVVDWIEVLSGNERATERIVHRTRRRWAPMPGPVPRIRPDVDVDRVSLEREHRAVTFEVRASHGNTSLRDLACEIYPEVFVGQRGRGAYSRLAGMAMQQPGDIVDALPEGTQEWFRVHGLEHAASWVSTVARFRDKF